MKIVKPDAHELFQGTNSFEDILKHIEVVGRVCYKSEDRIAPGSAEKFVNMLRSHAHGAMLEHGTIYLTVPEYNLRDDEGKCLEGEYQVLRTNKYTELRYNDSDQNDKTAYITTNYRVIVENELENIMNKYIVYAPTEYHEKRRTFIMTCDRGVSHEFVRHRVAGFAQESQRYVSYDKAKFGSEIKFVEPPFFVDGTLQRALWLNACSEAEKAYFTLRNNGATAQEARTVLPNSTATTLVMTQFECDWGHFFMLRCAPDAHPQAREVANMIKERF